MEYRYEVVWVNKGKLCVKEFAAGEDPDPLELPNNVESFYAQLGNISKMIYVLDGNSFCSYGNDKKFGNPHVMPEQEQWSLPEPVTVDQFDII